MKRKITISIPEDLLQELKKYSERYNMTVSSIITLACIKYLKELRELETDKK